MKLLVLSDIHSNICALEAIWQAESDADAIVSAGDLTDYGPFPRQVIAWFRAHAVKTVCGNHDRNLIRVWESMKALPEQLPREEYRWVHYNCERLEQDDVDYLKSLPEALEFAADGYSYRITHQYDRGYSRPQSVHDMDRFLAGMPFSGTNLPMRLILGHSHRQAICQFRDNRLFLNPGSVSYRRPDDPDKTAHYAVICGGEIRLKSVAYDRTPLLSETIRLAKSHRMSESELRHAFFFFGSAPDTETPVEESLRREDDRGGRI